MPVNVHVVAELMKGAVCIAVPKRVTTRVRVRNRAWIQFVRQENGVTKRFVAAWGLSLAENAVKIVKGQNVG